MKKAQKKKRAASLIGACLLCMVSVLTVFGSLGASAVSDSDNILYLNIPDSPELLQPCKYDRKILFFGTGCTFHATIRIGDSGNWGPLIPIGGKGLIDAGANTDDRWGPLIPVNGSENGGTVSTQAETRSGGGLIVIDQQDIDLYIYGMVTLAATKEDGLRIEWSKNCTVQNSANMDLQLGDFEFRNGKWSNTDTEEYRVTSVKNIRIEIPTDQSYLVDGGELKTYLGIQIQNGYDRGYESGFNVGNLEGYESGFDDGVTLGEETGYSQGLTNGMNLGRYEGFQDGHRTGYNEGYDQGFNEGFEMGNEIGTNAGIELGIDIGEKSAKSDAMDQIEVAKGTATEEDLPIFRDVNKLPGWKEILTDYAGFCYGKGHGDGMAEGRTDALNSTNTFKNVVIAIFTAPGHLIDTILDFNLLGINIADLVKTLITVSIVALIAYYVLKAIRG